jgi:hypothetical protein
MLRGLALIYLHASFAHWSSQSLETVGIDFRAAVANFLVNTIGYASEIYIPQIN